LAGTRCAHFSCESGEPTRQQSSVNSKEAKTNKNLSEGAAT
jgi:hypothetical protein